MGTGLSKCSRDVKSAIHGRNGSFRQPKKRVREISTPEDDRQSSSCDPMIGQASPLIDQENSTTEEEKPSSSSSSSYPMTGRALPSIEEIKTTRDGVSDQKKREADLKIAGEIHSGGNISSVSTENIYGDGEDIYSQGEVLEETLPVVPDRPLRSQSPQVALPRSAPETVRVTSVHPQILPSQRGPRGLGESKALACLIYVICHHLHSKMLLKLTTVFIEHDSVKQQQELREKVGRMEFGKQVHEDCHYLYAAHKEDVGVIVSDLRGGWKTEKGGCEVVKVFKYRKLWDGIMCITPTYFKTPAESQPELFGATFKIQQDGLVEEATTFDVCEPTIKIIAKASRKPSKSRCHDTAVDDDKSYEVTSSSGSSNDTAVTVGSLAGVSTPAY